jgi:hypothetical protein
MSETSERVVTNEGWGEELHLLHRVFLQDHSGEETLSIVGEAGAYSGSATLGLSDGVHCVGISFSVDQDHDDDEDSGIDACMAKLDRLEEAIAVLRDWLPRCNEHHQKRHAENKAEREAAKATSSP